MTAVEWLVSQLNKQGFAQVVTDEEIQQAKELEKQQQGYSEEDMKLMFEFGYRNNNFIESTFKDALNYIEQKKEIK